MTTPVAAIPKPASASVQSRRVGLACCVAIVAAIMLAPSFGLPAFLQSLMIEIMLFAIVAMSLDVLLGYTGLVSLGHAAFFGIAAYASAIIANAVSTEIWVTLPASIAITMLVALPVGWLCIRLSGFYFLMITFALAQMVFVAASRWKWLSGGSDGMLINGPTLFNQPVLESRDSLYYFALVCFCCVFLLLWRIVHAPFGQALVGIRENTRRMRAIGFDVRRIKLTAFVLSAGIAGLAGTVDGYFNLFISPEAVDWTQSAQILVMVLIGGAGTLVGPVIGTALVLLLQNWISSFTQYSSLALGIIFIAIVTGARDGLVGLAKSLSARLKMGER